MNLIGWNILPDDASSEFKFEDGPKWLELLALTPYFEKFAYPEGVKRGLGILWCPKVSEKEAQALELIGWKVFHREKNIQEKFLEGSAALLSETNAKRIRLSFSFTRLGRQRTLRKLIHTSNGT